MTRHVFGKENGNAVFLVLLAIALLAALTFVASNDSSTSANNLTRERARLLAAEILEFSNAVAHAVAQLRLRGCAADEISFENDIDANYTNNNAPTDNTCHVFHVSGAGVNWGDPP